LYHELKANLNFGRSHTCCLIVWTRPVCHTVIVPDGMRSSWPEPARCELLGKY